MKVQSMWGDKESCITFWLGMEWRAVRLRGVRSKAWHRMRKGQVGGSHRYTLINFVVFILGLYVANRHLLNSVSIFI